MTGKPRHEHEPRSFGNGNWWVCIKCGRTIRQQSNGKWVLR